MAIKYGFFDAASFDPQTIDGQTILVPDRAYSADDMNDYLNSLITHSGVVLQYMSSFFVTKINEDDGSGFRFAVKAGCGRIRGHYVTNDDDAIVTVPYGSVDGDRWDNIILRLSLNERKIELKLLSGTPGQPSTGMHIHRDVFPATSNENNPSKYYDLVLATLYIPANADDIASVMVTQIIGDRTYCPYITHIIATTAGRDSALENIDKLLELTTGAFAEWFSTLTDSLEVSTTITQRHQYYNAGNNWDLNQIDNYTYSCDDDGNPRDVINVYYNGLRLREEEYRISSLGILRVRDGIDISNTGNEVYVQILVSQVGIPTYVNGDLIQY